MKLTKIELGMHHHGYGVGAEPGIKCEVELRLPGSYSNVSIKLTPDQIKDVVARAVEHAMTQIVFDPDTIDVVGKPGAPREERVPATATATSEDMPL
ncbi:hypothetical protein [Sphingomonas montanisoli]|uniref:Uncharacterized protein n=1 Tax=Sphingomonas montanisoli TaxID=2606412 RepID=A0A5D9C6J4_9SPHN|nr:hypothetical protein [Sphingomonas montanisoli]TZG25621.1 hypothetical protein FYJ91_11385 [Sphingomonas montanisoli]